MAANQPAAVAQDEWKTYQNRIEQSRAESEKRYERWRSEQGKTNQTWREAPNSDRDRFLDVPDSGLKPGSYTLRLPFGLNVRLNVPDDPQASKGAPAWGERTYGDVYQRARQISDHLQELHRDIRRKGPADLTAEAAHIHTQAVEVTNAVAARRPNAEMRTRFTEFDRLWHPFVHRIGREADIGSSVQRRVSIVDQLEDGLHQILRISPAAPYNRVLVAALTSELQQTTSALLKELKIDPRRTFDLRTITLWAQRVKQHAADLNATVAQDAPLATIVEEYEEFDRTWHRLLQQARLSPEVDAHVRRMARQVRQVDLQLHKELYVNVPIISDRQQLIHLSAAIAKSGDLLANELDDETGRARQELVDEARSFAYTARDLNGVLTGRPSPQAEQRAFKELLDSWTAFHLKLDALKADRFKESQTMAAQMMTDIQRLEGQLRD